MRRCTLEAGHGASHQIIISWDDDECFNPLEVAPQPQQEVHVDYDPAPIVPPAQPETCIACNHLHVGGICKCGCHAHI
jgi:hypothetical protein